MSNDIDIEAPKGMPAATMLSSSSHRSHSLPPTKFKPGGERHSSRPAEHFEPAHRNAIERLVALKNELREADDDIFWGHLMEGITSLCNAQCAFVTRKLAADEVDHKVAAPNISITEDDLLLPEAMAFYYKGGSLETTHRHSAQLLRSIPRSFITTDKIYLIPENLGSVVDSCGDGTPYPMEAYLAIPLFSAGKCFAHFGLMWTVDGLAMRDVPWAYLEMILHSLEDLISFRVSTTKSSAHEMNGCHLHRNQHDGAIDEWSQCPIKPTISVPSQTSTTSPSFKPYARSLSHELRTPMQGVVGTLDVMHAAVQETIEKRPDPSMLSVFEELREHIEVVQDSARRAIEAADNVVHAYDLDMQVPDTPQPSVEEEDSPTGNEKSRAGSTERRPNITLIEGSNISFNPYKNKRRPSPVDYYPSSSRQRSAKSRRRDSPAGREMSPRTAGVKSAVEESDKIIHATPQQQMEEVLNDAVAQRPQLGDDRSILQPPRPPPIFPPMVLKHTRIRDLLHLVIHESLTTGGRPDSIIVEPTDHGELIELRSRSSDGQPLTKRIDWSVDPSVPDALFFDERDLAKLVSCVFLNALKFTETGRITIRTSASSCVLINISDTGTGIPEDFLPNLFKPFAREDGSTTRSTEGLGLGLLVAKGLSRRLGGDLTCVRSSTTGPKRGSEFEIRLPKTPNDCVSRPGTPGAGTPAPSPANSLSSPDSNSAPDIELPAAAISSIESALSSAVPGCGLQGASLQTSDAPPLQPNRPEMPRRPSRTLSGPSFDRDLAEKYPLTFLVAEDNKINRKILVTMLGRLGYKDIYEAFNGKEAVRIMSEVLSGRSPISTTAITPGTVSAGASNKVLPHANPLFNSKQNPIDVILMDLWMPDMDGYQATERIIDMVEDHRKQISMRNPNMCLPSCPTVLAVSADVTDEALQRATNVGMEGYMTKPYKLTDLERLIVEFCWKRGQCQL